ncbi:DUF4221 family protein [Pontibacter sp. BAB1700]|uniref:DUF4221 family protein n=1 Tax=Pontibacter sp. BAB1700 TaxID=1144253 RepID=UPI0002E9C350|nr:DUF4221 family protein [Pontibacter sp. BAB1700]
MIACKSEEENSIAYTFTEKHISISGNYLSYYPLDCAIYNEDGKEMFAGFNHLDHSIDFISLDGKGQNSSIALAKDGPDKVSNMGPFAMVSDSIIINGNYFMYVVDKQGHRLQHYNALSRHSQVSFSGLDLDKYRINLPDGIVTQYGKGNDLILAKGGNSLIVPMYRGGKRTQAEFYDDNAFALVNLPRRNIEPIPVKFPEEYRTEFYGELDKPGYTLVGHKLVYNYPISSAIYTYDLETGEQQNYHADSRFVPNQTSPTTLADYEDIRRQTKHTFHSSQFFRITYDPYRKHYYRMQKGQTEGEGLQNVRNNRYFTVMDENFKILAEIPIEDSNYDSNYLIGREGVYFRLIDNGVGQNQLSFAILKFE